MSDTEPRTRVSSTPTSEADKRWIAYRHKLEEEEPLRLEEAAKFLAGIIGVSISIFFSSNMLTEGAVKGFFVVAALLLMVALLLAFLVLMPRPYRSVKNSAQAIERMHRKAVTWKTGFLAGSVVAYVLALGMLAWAVLR